MDTAVSLDDRPSRMDRLRRWIDGLSTREPGSGLWLLTWTVVGGLALVGLCRLALAFTVTARAGIGIAGVAVVLIVALVCLAGLLWAAWRIRLDSAPFGRFAVAVAVSLIAIGVCTEAFAGLTVLLWRHGALAVAPGVEPTLWRTELYYLWHLVDSVPLLRIPDGLHWREPMRLTSPAGGGFLLAYKVLLIAPLLRLGIATYQWFSTEMHKEEAKRADLIRRKVLPRWWLDEPEEDEPEVSRPRWLIGSWRWLVSAGVLAAPVITGLLLPLVFTPGAGTDAVITRLLGGGDLAFLRTAPQWIVAALLVRAAFGTVGEVFKPLVRRGTELVQSVIWYAAAIGFVLVAASAINLALLHVGLASANVPVPAQEQVRAVVAAHAWQLADALPGPNIPGTLHWELTYTFTDRWSSLLMLLSKLAVLGIVLVPVGLAIRSFTHYVRLRTAAPGELGKAAEFAELFATARATTDQIDRTEPGFATQYTAGRAASSVIAKLDGLTTLFGRGAVTARADAAAGALLRRVRHRDPLGRDPEEFGRLRDEEARHFAEFLDAASRALAESSARVTAAAGESGSAGEQGDGSERVVPS